jgi:hypothetical protein
MEHSVKMNKTRLLAVAEALRSGRLYRVRRIGFNMRFWNEPVPGSLAAVTDVEGRVHCDTVACIGGHAVIMFGKYNPKYPAYEDDAVELLGLGCDDESELRGLGLLYGYVGDPTPVEAAQVIENLVRTGVVDWEAVCSTRARAMG